MHSPAPSSSKTVFPAPWPSSRYWLAGLLALAFALRLGSYLALRNAIHPDEVYQATEQAYRLVFGYGVVPWEFHAGARGWLWPGIIAGFFEAIKFVLGPASVGAIAVAALCSLISFIGVAAMFALGRLQSRAHAIIAGFIGASWVDFVYFGPHPFTEVIAASFLLAALSLMQMRASVRRTFFIGICLGMCLVMRFHLAPGLAVAAVWFARTKLKERWLPLCAGGLLVTAIYGAVDWLTWGAPFASIYNNFHANIVDGVASNYGTAPPAAYVKHLLVKWGGAFAFLAVLIWVGARRYPMLLAVALTIIVTHSFIAHKEYRFIFPAVACLIALAAIGTGDVVAFLEQKLEGSTIKRDLLSGALFVWGITSLTVAASPAFAPLWSATRPAIAAFNAAGKDPALCGLGLVGEPRAVYTPGYSGLRRNVPIYQPDSREPDKLQTVSQAFNLAISTQTQALPPGFVRMQCFAAPSVETLCLYKRAGACRGQSDPEIHQQLIEQVE